MLRKRESLVPQSPFRELYEVLVPEDHVLRRMKDLVDFSFIYDEVVDNYTVDFGRNAADPVYLFKLLLLKNMYPLSDRDLCERARYDMSFKFFLDLAPEEKIIDPSLLSKFRTQRLKNNKLLELLLWETSQIALEKGIPLGDTLIVDATHTHSRFRFYTPVETLRKQAELLRKACYRLDESLKESFPVKNTSNDLHEEIAYTAGLLATIEGQAKLFASPDVKEKFNLAKELMEDHHLASAAYTSKDTDAKVGHKSADSAFFGFKSHIAMTENGLITGLVVTSGEKADGKYLPELIEQSKRNGVSVHNIIGDAAYSGKDNLIVCKKEKIRLFAKLNPLVSQGSRKPEEEFYYNKDSDMFVCPEGHQAVRKARTGKKNQNTNQKMTYYFDIEKCKTCPLEGTCHKIGAKSKTYNVTLKSDLHQNQLAFEQTDEFRKKVKLRYQIEQKNSEVKNRYGLKRANSDGLFGMTLQSASAVFIANINKIIRLINSQEAQRA